MGSPLATSNLTTPVSPLREPPPYRPPPPAPLSPSSSNSHVSLEESATSISTHEKNDDSEPSSSMSPPVPPRRKSQDKLKVENKENVDRNRNSSLEAVIKVDSPLIILSIYSNIYLVCVSLKTYWRPLSMSSYSYDVSRNMKGMYIVSCQR